MAPRPGGGQGIAVGMSGTLIKVLPQQWGGGGGGGGIPRVCFFVLFSCYSHQSSSDYSWDYS